MPATLNDIFVRSLRSGYLTRLDLDFCLHLDRREEPLARFLYGHIMKRLGDKSVYGSWRATEQKTGVSQ